MGQFRSNISDPNVVRDFPNDVLKEMAADPAQPGKGPWSITLHPYLYRKFLEYCPVRAMRKNAYRAKALLGSRVVIQLENIPENVHGNKT